MPAPSSDFQSASHAPPLRAGIAMVMGAVICFACIDASAKWLNQGMHPMQTVAIRYLGSFILIGLLLNPRHKPGIQRTRRPWLQIARAASLVAMSVCTFIALRYLPLTVVVAISFIAPLIVALLAAPLLGESLGPRRLVAVFVGFTGVLVVTRPWGASFHPAMLLALLTAVFSALYSLATRALAGHDAPATTLFYTGMVAGLLVLPIPFFVWETPASPLVWVVMAAFGSFGVLGHWLLILAHMRAPASALAPYFYTHLLWTVVLGALIFGEVPDRWTVLGSSIVMASGLYLLYRERVRQSRPSVDLPV